MHGKMEESLLQGRPTQTREAHSQGIPAYSWQMASNVQMALKCHHS